jgi:MoxR-like ATPase
LEGREYVIPDDVKAFYISTLIHRLILEPDLWLVRSASNEILQEILDSVPVPVLSER